MPRRTASDKILHDKSFKNPNNDGYQKGLGWMVHNFFHKKSATHAQSENLAMYNEFSGGAAVKSKIMSNQKLAKIHSSFIDYIWGADLNLIEEFVFYLY